MERTHWLLRGQAAPAIARAAATSRARLIHDVLAGRYGVKAAMAPPFLLPRRGPATDGEREALRLPLPVLRKLPGPAGGHRPDAGR